MRHPRSILAAAVVASAIAAIFAACTHPSLAPYDVFVIKPSPPRPSALKARFMGVSTILLDDDSTAIMTDGFFSRPGNFSVLFGKIGPNAHKIDYALDTARAGHLAKRLAAVLVAHAHYDHALDSRAVAERTGAYLVGSASVLRIDSGHVVAKTQKVNADMVANTQEIEGGSSLSYGRFKVRVIASPHTPDAHFPGVIAKPLRTPARVSEYREGGSFSFLIEHDGHHLLIHPSTNFTPHFLDGVRADVVFLGIALLGRQSEEFRLNYWREVVRATGAKLVVPIHWDDFTRSIDKSLEPMPRLFDDVDTGIRWVLQMAEADGVKVRFMPAFMPVDILAEIDRRP